MKLELGKYYKTRDGCKVGPMKLWLEGPSMHADESEDSYDPDGKAQSFGENSEHDLISEWSDTHTTGTLAELGVQPGDVVEFIEGRNNAYGYTYPTGPETVLDRVLVFGIKPEYDDAIWRIVSRASDLSKLDYTPINVEKPIYEIEPDTRPLEHFQPGPVITETVKRILPGVYGDVEISEDFTHQGGIGAYMNTTLDAPRIRAVIATLTQIADAMPSE